jgi:hypothetical protein
VDFLRERFKDENNVGVTCIYCNFKEQDVQTPVNLIASLWRQLVTDRSHLSRDVRDLHSLHVDCGTRPSLSEMSRILQSEIEGYSKVFVIVDALDECPDDGSRGELLSELRAFPQTVNFLVTSRFDDAIERAFGKTKQLELSANAQDVRKYVAGRISRSDRLSRHVKRDPKLAEEIAMTVVGNARKMYVSESSSFYVALNRDIQAFSHCLLQVLASSTSYGFLGNTVHFKGCSKSFEDLTRRIGRYVP